MMIMTMKQVLSHGEEMYMHSGFIFYDQGAIECTVRFRIIVLYRGER
jgi:hypothetical protein